MYMPEDYDYPYALEERETEESKDLRHQIINAKDDLKLLVELLGSEGTKDTFAINNTLEDLCWILNVKFTQTINL